ncbi:MAG TPA: rod shape-determining protein MreD [Opitutus sp.]|nr:rod shape-determining protein MreD [Opitutus sp.]
MRRTLVIFLSLVLLWLVVSQFNHALSTLHIYLSIGGLFVTYAALALPLRAGLAAVFLGGLVCDAATPVAFGLHALLFSAAHYALFRVRDRVPRDETVARVVIALLANLALFLVFSFLEVSRLPEPAAVWPRIAFDLICSQVFLTVIAPWFFALQERALALARVSPDEHDRAFG